MIKAISAITKTDLRYSRPMTHIVHSIELDGDDCLYVACADGWGDYEWFLCRGAEVVGHSDDSFGSAHRALLAGLQWGDKECYL